MSIRALVLEDDTLRIAEFEQRFAERGWTADFADNAIDAVKFIDENDYDIIFLDHDLGGEIYVDSGNKNTGSEVARHMASKETRFSGTVIVHSLNYAGSENIVGTLNRVGIYAVKAPGIWIKERFTSICVR